MDGDYYKSWKYDFEEQVSQITHTKIFFSVYIPNVQTRKHFFIPPCANSKLNWTTKANKIWMEGDYYKSWKCDFQEQISLVVHIKISSICLLNLPTRK